VNDNRKVTLYAPIELLRRLKAKLALKGSTISEWFRNKAQEEIDKQD